MEPKKESPTMSIAKGILIAFAVIAGVLFLLGLINGATGG